MADNLELAEEFAISEMEFDLADAPSDEIDAPADVDTFPDPDNECICERAVKEKNGSQNCLICGKNAYNSQYSFAHTEAGKLLLANANVTSGRLIPFPPQPPNLGVVPAPPRMESDKPAKPLKPPKAPKAPKVKKAAAPVNQLLEALKFIALAQKSKATAKDDPMMSHCMIAYGGITAFDRTIACGTVVREDDLYCMPNTEMLMTALSRCGVEYKIVQLADSLYLSSGDYSAYVQLTTPDKMVTAVPDPMIAPLGETFREALKSVGSLVKDTGATLLQAAIQLNPYTVIATNGLVIMEAQHGFDMPPNRMLVPKAFADRINKTKKVIVGFGFNDQSAEPTFTVWFEDRSWLRTNLYKGALELDLLSKINVEATQKHVIPANFFDAAEEVSKFSKDGRVFMFDNRISSNSRDEQTAGACRTFAIDSFTNNRIYSIAALKTISKYAISMDDKTVRGLTLFFGKTVRGAIMHDSMPEPIVHQEWSYCPVCQQTSHHNASHQCRNPACAKFGVEDVHDDNIPF